jgi:hypothetical protein
MENKITAKAKKRYFRINRLFIDIRIIWQSPMLFIIFLLITFPKDAFEYPWKTIFLSILAGSIFSLAYICMRWWCNIDLVEKGKELHEIFNLNEEKIKNLQEKIISREEPTKKDRKLFQKIKKIRSKNEQIQIELKVLNM